jgi:hypothetical protein
MSTIPPVVHDAAASNQVPVDPEETLSCQLRKSTQRAHEAAEESLFVK